MLNVAAGKAPMQSSVADGGIPQKAIDGSTSTFFDSDTCSLTEVRQQSAHIALFANPTIFVAWNQFIRSLFNLC